MSWFALLPLLGIWTLAVISPGPDFVITLRYAAGRSWRSGLRVAAGVTTGIAVWALAALFGLTVVIERYEWLYTAGRVAGALFLVALGVATIRAARRAAPADTHGPATRAGAGADAAAVAESPRGSAGPDALPDEGAAAGEGFGRAGGTGPGSGFREWRVGLFTNLANPKALAFFGALFASLLPHGAGLAARAATLATMVAIAFAWFGIVSVLAATPVITRLYRRARRRLDIITGAIFIGMGGLLIPR
ncbi:lysine transporter LysE [Sphaerisporangium melleum]|uniref:Lysine transporter LysE n=1 Tax=Sphaerisporangium melleum TaxID=321316 RepID=A0A917RFJ4_9ACTN|nr:LysE family translocator [Sphaerisporangium melleum]GGL05600.1 lysine transporter LysE [Sphaerisporangium melleum]GII73185.1 lysine transporter LysE [Sphaerisporangium melleum]